MAYTPKEWQCGEIVTAESLNNIEGGIQEALNCCGGGSSGDLSLWVINVTGAPIVADKTFEDITNALEQGKYPIVIYKAFANASPKYLPLYGLESDYYYIFSHSYYEPENEGSEYVDPPRIVTITVSIRKDGTVSVESGAVEQKGN